MSQPSLATGRLLIVLASLLWSLSGAFKSALTHDTPIGSALGLREPTLDSMQIAFYRVLFAGLVLLPILRRTDLVWNPRLIPMAITFALMNALFVTALTQGTAADAIWLQYTGPLWMYLACVYLLGEPPDRRAFRALLVGLVGVAVILFGGWYWSPTTGRPASDLPPTAILAIALASGVAYAGVLVWLRVLRDVSPTWLTVVNHLGSAMLLAPFALWQPQPNWAQLAWLAVFGAVQMSIPYVLMARALRTVSPQEAGMLTLVEPLLNPCWAYLVAGDAERVSVPTLVGGAIILGALAWRYAGPQSGKG